MNHKKLLEKIVLNKIHKERAKKIIMKYDIKEFLDIGRHSIILKKNGRCYKVEKDIPAGKNACLNEYENLKRLKKYEWVVKNFKYDQELRVLAYNYVKGVFLPTFIETNLLNKNKIKRILIKCFKICYILDKSGYNKLEMHKPVKHIIIGKYNKITFLDFERMYESKRPKNVSQFATYVFFHNKITKTLFKKDKKNFFKVLKNYKDNINKENFSKVLKLLN